MKYKKTDIKCYFNTLYLFRYSCVFGFLVKTKTKKKKTYILTK